MRCEMERAGLQLPKIRTFCTMNYFTGITGLRRKINTGRPKPPKLIELADFMNLSDEAIEENCLKWFGGGEAAHDARFDAAMTYMCMVEGTRRGLVRGIL